VTQPGQTAAAQADAAAEAGAAPPSRRDRLRAATTEEIIATARRLLVESGPEAVSLRAIAREMGMTAPGLYRYFDSQKELVRHVIAAIFLELSADIRRAIDAATPPAPVAGASGTGAGQERERAKMTVKMIAACREFRRWSLRHRAEFSLLFGVPLPGMGDEQYDVAQQCALAFAGTFFALFMELWRAFPFPLPDAAGIDAGLRDQLTRYRDSLGADIPVGAVLIFLRCWTVLYGAVAMEVFGHMRFALEDGAPMFEFTLGDLAALIGLRYPLDR